MSDVILRSQWAFLLSAALVLAGCGGAETTESSTSMAATSQAMVQSDAPDAWPGHRDSPQSGAFIGRTTGGSEVRFRLEQTPEGVVGYGTLGGLPAVFVERDMHAIHGTLALEDGRSQDLTILLAPGGETPHLRSGPPIQLKPTTRPTAEPGRLSGRFEAAADSEGRIPRANLAHTDGTVGGIVVVAGQRCVLVAQMNDDDSFSGNLAFPNGSVTAVTGRLDSHGGLVIEGAGPPATLSRAK